MTKVAVRGTKDSLGNSSWMQPAVQASVLCRDRFFPARFSGRLIVDTRGASCHTVHRRIEAITERRRQLDAHRQNLREQARQVLERNPDQWSRRQFAEAARLAQRMRSIDPTGREARRLENILAGHVTAYRPIHDSWQVPRSSELAGIPTSPGRNNTSVAYPDGKRWAAISRRTPLSPAGTEDAERKALRRENQAIAQLARTVAQVHFAEGMTFAEIVGWFQKQGRLDVVPHWRDLEESGITRDTELAGPVTLHDVSLVTVLNIILKQLSPLEPEARLDWDFPAGVLVISTRRNLYSINNRHAARLNVYDVSDSLHEIPRPGVGIPGGGMGTGFSGGFEVMDMGTARPAY